MHEKGRKADRDRPLAALRRRLCARPATSIFSAPAANGKRVACIGSGPASLACAAELAQAATTSRSSIAMNSPAASTPTASPPTNCAPAIPCAKWKWSQARRRIPAKDRNWPRHHFRTTRNGIRRDFHRRGPRRNLGPRLPGENLHGVCGAMEFIERTKVAFLCRSVKSAAASPASAQGTPRSTWSQRRGASAPNLCYLIYRRSENEMPAFRYEYELAKHDGVLFLWQTQPVRILGDEGRVTAIECVRNALGARKRRERGTFVAFREANSSSTWTWSCAPWAKSPSRISFAP